MNARLPIFADPAGDAARHFDQLEARGDAAEREQAAEELRLSRAFIDAAEWGADEPLNGSTVAEALYEVSSSKPELIDAIVYRAFSLRDEPVWRSLTADIADTWAAIKASEKPFPLAIVRKRIDNHPAMPIGSADAI